MDQNHLQKRQTHLHRQVDQVICFRVSGKMSRLISDSECLAVKSSNLALSVLECQIILPQKHLNKGHSSALQNHSIPKGRRANKYCIDNDKILLIMIISEYEVYKINFQTPLDESAKSPNISNLTTIQSNYEHILSNLRSNCS